MSSGSSNPAGTDRHLKKIYDCLNIGSNKKAVQKVDSLPKDVKDLTVYKALKALALVRMGKRRQAFQILDEINPEEDLDELTLQTMTSCYKESVEVGRIVNLYEAAAARKPDDPEIMAHLFMAHARVFNFKRQKEIALQMYKSFSKQKRLYFFWAIMSLVMQSQEVTLGDTENPDKRVCLTLAERMCEKMIEEERTHEEIELFLTILRKQQKHEEEYRFLTGQFCLRVTDHLSWFNRRRAYLCLDLKMYSRAFKHYFPTLIQEYPDQIEYYQGLFKSAFLLDTEAPSQQQPVAINDQQSAGASQVTTGTPVKTTSALAECYDIVEKQCQLALEGGDSAKDPGAKGKGQAGAKNLSRTSSLNPNRKRILRGPYMARIEFYHTVLSNESVLPKSVYNQCMGQFSAKHPSLSALLADFFQAFSKKLVCFHDLDYLINKCKLKRKETTDFLEMIKIWVEELKQQQRQQQQQTHTEAGSLDMFYSVLNYHMIEHALHEYSISDALDSRLALAKKYISLYDANRELGAKSSKTEFLPVDHYCLLVINSLTTNAIDAKQTISAQSILTDQILVSLMVMAENAIVESPSNHQIKLLLLKLYSFIGASRTSSDVLLALDIKHFQIDTLGHLLNPVLYNTGNYSLSRESLELCTEFYANGVRECFGGLTTSYRDGRFSKIEEISKVLRRLCDSLNATQCALLKGIVSNLNAATIEELGAASQSFDPFQSLYRMFRCPEFTERIKDNRDFKVLRSLHFGVDDLVNRRKQETLEDEELWLRLRYYLVRSAYLQLDNYSVISTSNAGGSKAAARTNQQAEVVAEIEHGSREIDSLVPKIKERLATSPRDNQYSYLEPESSPFRWPHIRFDALIDLVKPLVFCTNTLSLTQDVHDSYLATLDKLVADIESRLATIGNFVAAKQALMSMTIAVEFLSLCVTSLVSLSHIESSASSSNNQPGASQPSSGGAIGKSAPNSTNQVSPPSAQQQANLKSTKSIVQQMINKTEAQLTRISSAIKGVDLKASLLDKISHVDERLLSDLSTENKPTSSGADLSPLMGDTVCQAMLLKVKEKIMDSYADSLKEIDATCKRKAKLLRAKA